MLRTFPVRALAAGALAVAAFALVAPSAASAGPRSGMPRVTDHSDSFYGIGCTPTKGCLAVGSWYSSTTKKVYALGETRTKHSSTWVIHDPADIPGATTTGFGPIGNGETVSCVSKPKAVCMGIGSYNDSSYHQHNYAAEWNWSKWKIVKPPDPSPTISSGLDAVKCTSSVFCMAVGHWDNSSTFKFELESEVWNGTSWSLKAMPPTPSGATSPRLWGLSCLSPTWCMAVGDYDVGSAQPLLSEIWNGSKWTMHLPPNPSGVEGSALLGVSCLSTTFCNAVGDSVTPKFAFDALGEIWNGTSWKIDPTPSAGKKKLSTLFDVSCLSTTFCLTVGGLAAEWNGSSWTRLTFPHPAGSLLTNAVSISCLSTTHCAIAGDYGTKTSTLTLIMNWNGKSLKLQAAQNP
jgi:hypothetical protein